MITLEDAKSLKSGTILYSLANYNRKGDPARYRVNGAVQTWKRDPSRVRVPLKHGLYAYDYLTEDNLHWYTLDEEYARRARGCYQVSTITYLDPSHGYRIMQSSTLTQIADPNVA